MGVAWEILAPIGCLADLGFCLVDARLPSSDSLWLVED